MKAYYQKLSEYYTNTYKERSLLYNITIVLYPTYKLDYYKDLVQEDQESDSKANNYKDNSDANSNNTIDEPPVYLNNKYNINEEKLDQQRYF